MADEYHAGICTGNLWNSSRNFPIGTYSPCSMMLSDNIGSFGGWSIDVMNMDSKQNRFTCDDNYDHSTSIWDDLSLIHGDESGQINNNSSRLNYHQEVEMGATNWTSKQFSEINDEKSMNVPCQDVPMTNFVGSNNLFESSSTILQNLFEELEYETPPNDHNNFTASSNNFSSSWSKILSSNQSTCSNNTSYWNNVAQKAHLDDSTFEDKHNSCTNLRLKTKNELRVLMGKKNNIVDEPAYKRPRIETPSHMPTFKVRKEKLGDRVTALQQLVSPFGKTDTASVLHEAIDYIKYLHDQVSALSTPYTKDVAQNTQHQQVNLSSNKQSLRSQGLCLVPISSTYAMANQFW